MISQAKKLELITKHAKHFTTKPNGATPVLEGVHYNVDGSAVCTDRHVLLRIGNAHNFTEEFTSHAKTGVPIDGVYPDTSRIIPQDLPTQITLISNGYKRNDLADMIARVKVAFEAAKLNGKRTHVNGMNTKEICVSFLRSFQTFCLNCMEKAKKPEIFGVNISRTAKCKVATRR